MNELTVVHKKEVAAPRNVLAELKEIEDICSALMRTPHYKKMGAEGIYAVILKARSLKIDPIEALNDCLYPCNGKVEMYSHFMAMMIRQEGHSIQKDPKSCEQKCILKGKRADNGDEWIASFSIDDAKKAGIYNERGPWGKYTDDMLYSRALSRLARQLFPDVIKGCYVRGEISESPNLHDPVKTEKKPEPQQLSDDQISQLEEAFVEFPDVKEKAQQYLQNTQSLSDVKKMPLAFFERLMAHVSRLREDLVVNQEISEEIPEEEQMSQDDYLKAQGE